LSEISGCIFEWDFTRYYDGPILNSEFVGIFISPPVYIKILFECSLSKSFFLVYNYDIDFSSTFYFDSYSCSILIAFILFKRPFLSIVFSFYSSIDIAAILRKGLIFKIYI